MVFKIKSGSLRLVQFILIIIFNYQFCNSQIYEIGGTVGDIESLPFLEAIRQLGLEIGKSNAIFIHFSTDAVFEGTKNTTYTVNDTPFPTTIYGKSKLLGEKYISHYKKTLIVRLSLLYGKHHKNQIIIHILQMDV